MPPVSLPSTILYLLGRSFVLLLGLSCVLSLPVTSFQPNCTLESTYTSIDGRGLFVQGGVGETLGFDPQAFMIDLSKSWDTDKPLYTEMTPGRRQNYSPSGISSDGQKWIAYIENQQWAYDFNSKNWTKIFEHRIRGSYGLTGATDPRTDMLYIPFGYPNMDGTMGTMRVDLKTGIATSDYRNFTLANNKLYAATWNPHLDSVVFVSPSGIFSYTWKDGWKQMRTTGLGVGEIPHRGACLVSVSGGKKMVLFGGADQNVTVYSRDVHILDVDQGVWTKGPSISPEDARNAPACAGSNDQVIIWGGNTEAFASKKFHCPTHQVLVFDVKTNTWVNSIVPIRPVKLEAQAESYCDPAPVPDSSWSDLWCFGHE